MHVFELFTVPASLVLWSANGLVSAVGAKQATRASSRSI